VPPPLTGFEGWHLNRTGRNRWVLLTRRYAFKFPTLASWRDFLFGLLNNQNEAANCHRDGACPVLWACPGGWLLVMPRCVTMDEDIFALFDSVAWAKRTGLRVEHKPDSFGFHQGRIVAVDYGW
jgi:hypothetical protein